MASASYPYSSYRQKPPLRRRIAAILLALIVNALIVLVLLGIANLPALKPKPKRPPVFVQIDSNDSSDATASQKATKRAAGAAKSAQKVRDRPKTPNTPPVPPPPLPASAAVMPPGFIHLTHDEYAASDIGKMPRSTNGAGEALAGTGDSDGEAGAPRSVGTAPNGEPLYQAEWYRPPTDAELAPYRPRSGPLVGTGLIICRTAARYRVEDCQELATSPPGSGFAHAARQAAFQFLVRPPSRGGKPMIGSWVRIRIDYTMRERGDGGG